MIHTLPKSLVKLIYEFAAYTSPDWIHVAEHKYGNYAWLPSVSHMEQDLIDLPMW